MKELAGKPSRTLRHRISVFCLSLVLSGWGVVRAEPLTLVQTLGLLEGKNPALAGAEARRESAQAALVTAKAYPNPEIEVGGGSSTGIGQGALNGDNELLYLSQPLDLPFVREARRKVADAGIVSADEANRAVWLAVRAQARLAFYDILRRQAELALAEDNERLLGAIRDKVKLKVEIGEAARYETVKADAEWLNAVKLRESAGVRVDDAKSALRALFGSALPAQFDAVGELPEAPVSLPGLETLRETVLSTQPALHYARAEVEKAQAKLRLEEKLRYPQLTLRAGAERDPGLEQYRIGFSLPLPLWNQRQGPIGEAQADLKQSEAQASQQELTVLRELENAYNRYRIAHRQVETFESGLMKQAENALKVAEAAYRLGERGILDYLDAQRTYRSVRNDYLNARFDRQGALIDLERLTAADLKDKQP
ncbi:TolC family protein [Methylococcus sp. EFPC2]|uniref:TolC family protein n=1 Tax=Methylococcus sp. EFPC2 TaxID=2812648 RepID=UPI0019682B1D|nr:TolC family protein [Methylococcus sp. EFPC2]QSA95853.1 TolC family protein [Methylococcus sp. EFPC2]